MSLAALSVSVLTQPSASPFFYSVFFFIYFRGPNDSVGGVSSLYSMGSSANSSDESVYNRMYPTMGPNLVSGPGAGKKSRGLKSSLGRLFSKKDKVCS
jgi:hypothetical protein